jgi:hypothetical protein
VTELSGDAAVAEELRRLREQVASLQAEVGRLAAPPEVEPVPEPEPSFAWLTALEAPGRQRLAVPRVVLEVAFLVAVAVVAALANLEPLVIASVMAGAWLLVALAEWAGSRAERERKALLLAPPPVPVEEPGEDAAWFLPPVEQTLLENGASPDSDTVVAKLPPVAESEQTAERRPA